MNEAMERQAYMQSLTKRLVIFTMATLFFLGVSLYFFIDTAVKQDKSFLVIMVFMCGLLGGFVSIQQRLPKITLDEMKVLSSSWVSITLIPINGGIFALILMLMFVGQIVQGDMFPHYPDPPVADAPGFMNWIQHSYPSSGREIAKLLFWSFVSGFSERFVPQIIRRTVDQAEQGDKPAGGSTAPADTPVAPGPVAKPKEPAKPGAVTPPLMASTPAGKSEEKGDTPTGASPAAQ